MGDVSDLRAGVAYPVPEVPVAGLVEQPRLGVVAHVRQAARVHHGRVDDPAVGEREAAQQAPGAGARLRHRDAEREVGARPQRVEQHGDVVVREGVVVVERRDHVPARLLDQPVDGRGARHLPERARPRRVAWPLLDLEVADARVRESLDCGAGVRLRPVAADEQLDVAIAACEDRRDRALEQQVDRAEGGDADRHQRFAFEPHGARGGQQRAVDLRLELVDQCLDPARMDHGRLGVAGQRRNGEPEALDQVAGAGHRIVAEVDVVDHEQDLGEVTPLGHVLAGALEQLGDGVHGQLAATGVERQARVAVERRRDDVGGQRGQPVERPAPIRREHEDRARLGLEPAHAGNGMAQPRRT